MTPHAQLKRIHARQARIDARRGDELLADPDYSARRWRAARKEMK